MKKIITLSAILSAALAVNAQASTGVITFNGELTASTCNVVVDGQSNDATVTLPTVSTSDLVVAGNTAGTTGFSMNLTACTGSLTTASAFFESGISTDASTGRLTNTTGTATGVTLQLRDGTNDAVINAGQASQKADTSYVAVADGVLPYTVEYYAEDATAAGTVISSVTYSIQYQ